MGYPTSVFIHLYRSQAISSTNDDCSLILIFVTKSQWVNICLCRIVVHMYIWICRDHFVYVPSQWETTLQCNMVSHWLAAYTKRSLNMSTKLNYCWVYIFTSFYWADNVFQIYRKYFSIKCVLNDNMKWTIGCYEAVIISAIHLL